MSARQICVGSALIILFMIIARVQSGPVSTITDAQLYLEKYGYLEASAQSSRNGALFDLNTLNKAVKQFQNFTGLRTTGELNNDTMRYMSLPRCGVRDQLDHGNGNRSKRYSLWGSRWRATVITYNITSYPRNLQKPEVRSEIARAFAVWSKYTNLKFTFKKTGPVHMKIKFVYRDHGDDNAFDDKDDDLAHALPPEAGGDVHFNRAKDWTIDSFNGSNLFQVAVHEFGHSLGLHHSNVRTAAMAPFFHGYNPEFQLDSDDVYAIQALYRTNDVDFPHPTLEPIFAAPPEPPSYNFSEDGKIDAIFKSDGKIYIFRGDIYYVQNSLLHERNARPKYISDRWPGLPGNIDAAFVYSNGKTYFFKHHLYWSYTGHRLDANYPKNISETFQHVPDNLDAILHWSAKKRILFFKNDEFVALDTNTEKIGPPQKSSTLRLPNNLDAALELNNGVVCLFKDRKIYKIFTNNPVEFREWEGWWL